MIEVRESGGVHIELRLGPCGSIASLEEKDDVKSARTYQFIPSLAGGEQRSS